MQLVSSRAWTQARKEKSLMVWDFGHWNRCLKLLESGKNLQSRGSWSTTLPKDGRMDKSPGFPQGSLWTRWGLTASESSRNLFRNTVSQASSLEAVIQEALVVPGVSTGKATGRFWEAAALEGPSARWLFKLASRALFKDTSFILASQFRQVGCAAGMGSDWNNDFLGPSYLPDSEPANCILGLSVEVVLRIAQAARPRADHWMASLSFLFRPDCCLAFTAPVRALKPPLASVCPDNGDMQSLVPTEPLDLQGWGCRPKQTLGEWTEWALLKVKESFAS